MLDTPHTFMDWLNILRALKRAYPVMAGKPSLRGQLQALRDSLQTDAEREAVVALVPVEAQQQMRAWLFTPDGTRLNSQ